MGVDREAEIAENLRPQAVPQADILKSDHVSLRATAPRLKSFYSTAYQLGSARKATKRRHATVRQGARGSRRGRRQGPEKSARPPPAVVSDPLTNGLLPF